MTLKWQPALTMSGRVLRKNVVRNTRMGRDSNLESGAVMRHLRSQAHIGVNAVRSFFPLVPGKGGDERGKAVNFDSPNGSRLARPGT